MNKRRFSLLARRFHLMAGRQLISNWQIDTSISWVCPLIDHVFRQNIVKVAVGPQGDSRVYTQTTLTMLWQNLLSITGKMHEKMMSIFFFTRTNWQIVRSLANASHKLKVYASVRLLTMKISQWTCKNSCIYYKKINWILFQNAISNFSVTKSFV